MNTGSSIPAGLSRWKGRRTVYSLLALTAVAAGVAVYAISAALAAPAKEHVASAPAPRPHRAPRIVDAPPGPSEFARDVVGTTTAYAEAHGAAARITDVDCVEASSGHYMCSYAVTRPNRRRECRLMQATWTPNRASTYTVTLAGRVHRCGTLREALRSLE